jgi:hypothetical protein
VTDTSKDQFLKATIFGDAPTSWSPDEKYLLLESIPRNRMILFALDGSQKPIRVGTRTGSSGQGRISPNGRFIAFTSNESGRDEIYVQAMPPASAYQKVSINGGQSPRWKSDGKELVFVSPNVEMMAVDITLDPVFSAGVAHRLFQFKSEVLRDLVGYDVRPDGQRFLILMRQRGTQDAPITVVLNWWASCGRSHDCATRSKWIPRGKTAGLSKNATTTGTGPFSLDAAKSPPDSQAPRPACCQGLRPPGGPIFDIAICDVKDNRPWRPADIPASASTFPRKTSEIPQSRRFACSRFPNGRSIPEDPAGTN